MHNDDIRQLLTHCEAEIKNVEKSIADGILNKVALKKYSGKHEEYIGLFSKGCAC